MDTTDWVKLCNINFVTILKRLHFKRLAYFRRQGSNAKYKNKRSNAMGKSKLSLHPGSNDLHKSYSAKQWEAVHDLFQSSDMDDAKILSGDGVTKAFEQSREKIIKIRQEALLLFGFKSRAKEPPNLNVTIKFINAVIGNWCGYTIKSGRKREGPKTRHTWIQVIG
jgi:hypothetical protein